MDLTSTVKDVHSEEEWESAWSKDERLGLSFSSIRTLSNYYGAVVAVPIESKMRGCCGCIVLDTPPGTDLDAVTSEEVLSVLTEATEIVGEGLTKVPRHVYSTKGALALPGLLWRALGTDGG